MQSVSTLLFWPKTDVGRMRDINEDSFLVDEGLRLAIVADGMGGHAAGEIASNIAVRICRETIGREQELLECFEQRDESVGRHDILRLLEQAVQNACAAVYAEAQKDHGKRGMGTTLVLLLLVGSRGFIAHVGDSRIYLTRSGALHQLTEDHSLINELLKRGRLTPEQIAKLNMKNAVTRAVGVYETVEVDTLDFDVLAGDQFLLCSDGLSEYAQHSDILRVFREIAPEDIAQQLIDLANDGGGKDNITAVVVKIPDNRGLDDFAYELNLKLETLHLMPLFRHLTYQELVHVMNSTEVRGYQPGERILEEGQTGEELFIVLVGAVRVHGNDGIISALGPGKHFGEMSLVDKAPSTETVVSEGASRLMVIHRRDFFDIVRKNHDVAVKLLWSFLGVVTDRWREATRDLSEAREQLASRHESLLDLGPIELEDM
jgi:serine/threonine protein phosphatase PrpC